MNFRKRIAGKLQRTIVLSGLALSLLWIPLQAQNGAARRAVAERLDSFIRLARHETKVPRGWALGQFNYWLETHPSANSTCSNRSFANIGIFEWGDTKTEATDEPSCDGRLQVEI